MRATTEKDRRDGMYTVTLAARRLRLSYNQCYNRALAGHFGEVKDIKGRLYVNAADVERYGKQQAREATALQQTEKATA